MADQIPDSTKSEARELLAKAYADNGDLGAARYIRGGFDLYPDTGIALLAICDALATRAAPPAMDREAVEEAQFLLDRLEEFGREITDDEVFTHFDGHVSPSAARLRMCLSTLSADAIRQGEGECTLGVGCEQYGICYAEANGHPDQCDKVQANSKSDLQRALEASLAKRSQPTMDPPYTAAFNAALDMVARDVAPYLATPASHASDGGKA